MSDEQTTCDHRFIFLEAKRRTEDGSYQLHWILTERFYCERCLLQRVTTRDEWSREAPAWW